MRKGVLAGVVVLLAVVGGKRVCGQATSRDLAKARGAELGNLLRTVEGAAAEPPRTFRTTDGYVRFLSAPPARRFPAAAGTAQEQAEAFIERWRNLFVNESPEVTFEQNRVKAANGRSYIRHRQKYAGLEVFGAEMVVQVGDAGGVEAVISEIMRDTMALDTSKLSINPTINASTAQQKAMPRSK